VAPVICLGAASGFGADPGAVDESMAVEVSAPSIAGSAVCRECHPVFHDLWEHSRHGASVVPVTGEWAQRELGLLPGEVREVGGEVYRLGGAAQRLQVTVEKGAGGDERLQVEFALGGRDLWYLLGEFDGRGLQVLPVAYDRRRAEWFNPAASAVRPHAAEGSDGSDWRSPAYTFSEGCYVCHVSGAGGKGDDHPIATSRWWDEPGIRCESCHGPGAEHVRVCRETEEGESPPDLKIIVAGEFSASQVDGLCGSCHAKRAALTPQFRPGDLFADHFDLALMEDLDFTVDGRERGETYTMTSWLANSCAQRGGLSCLHCHTSSGRDRFPDERANEACLPCHEEKVSNVEEHSRHRLGEPGSRCIDCHLPVTEFARIRRHDHSFRPPTPATSREFETPNACNNCHRDQDATWADQHVREWHGGGSQAPVVERARWIDRAREQDWSDLDGLLSSLGDETDEPVYVASLIRLLGACDDERKIPVLIRALSHPSPWVQASAALGLEGHLTPRAVPGLVRLAGNELLLVRLRAAQTLAPLPDGVLGGAEQSQVKRAIGEYEALLRSRSEDPGVMEALGLFQLDRGDPDEAAQWLDRALGHDPERLALLISAGTAHYRAGEYGQAELRFWRAVEVHPQSGMAWSNWVKYLEWTGREKEATEARQAAVGRLRGSELERFGRADRLER